MSLEINYRSLPEETNKNGKGPEWGKINAKFPASDLKELRKQEKGSIEKYVPDNTQAEITRVKNTRSDDWEAMKIKLKEKEEEKKLSKEIPQKLDYL